MNKKNKDKALYLWGLGISLFICGLLAKLPSCWQMLFGVIAGGIVIALSVYYYYKD